MERTGLSDIACGDPWRGRSGVNAPGTRAFCRDQTVASRPHSGARHVRRARRPGPARGRSTVGVPGCVSRSHSGTSGTCVEGGGAAGGAAPPRLGAPPLVPFVRKWDGYNEPPPTSVLRESAERSSTLIRPCVSRSVDGSSLRMRNRITMTIGPARKSSLPCHVSPAFNVRNELVAQRFAI